METKNTIYAESLSLMRANKLFTSFAVTVYALARQYGQSVSEALAYAKLFDNTRYSYSVSDTYFDVSTESFNKVNRWLESQYVAHK